MTSAVGEYSIFEKHCAHYHFARGVNFCGDHSGLMDALSDGHGLACENSLSSSLQMQPASLAAAVDGPFLHNVAHRIDTTIVVLSVPANHDHQVVSTMADARMRTLLQSGVNSLHAPVIILGVAWNNPLAHAQLL